MSTIASLNFYGKEVIHLTERKELPSLGLKISLKSEQIVVNFQHPHVTTIEEEELMRTYYQQSFSRQAGFEVPRNEIYVRPKAGEEVMLITFFRLTNEDLAAPSYDIYTGLRLIHAERPEVLPRLSGEIYAYYDERRDKLELGKALLVLGVIDGINKIVEGKEDFGEYTG